MIDTIEPGSAFSGFDIENEGFWGVQIIDGEGATLGAVVDLEPDGNTFVTLPECVGNQQIAVATFKCSATGSGQETSQVSLVADLKGIAVSRAADALFDNARAFFEIDV